MKSNKRPSGSAAISRPPATKGWWQALLLLLGGLIILFEVYGPALNGPFLFDDTYLPFYEQGYDSQPLSVVVRSVRPLLMVSYWLNLKAAGLEPYSFHAVNLVLHLIAAAITGWILRRLLTLAGTKDWRRDWIAVFGAGLFLLHPVQTESVAYIASRSEILSVLLAYLAFGVFLARREPIVSWRLIAALLALTALAALAKEHAAVLPAFYLMADYYFNPGYSFEGIKRNWRFYIPFVFFGALGAVFVAWILRTSTSAGFALKEFTWYQYFFTECRVIWRYVLLFIAPAGQNADYDIAPSHSLLQGGAFIGLIALIAASAVAWRYRRSFPLASFGWFFFLIALAPTSSFLPIQDPMAERRMYLPFLGLLLIAAEGLRRLKLDKVKLGAAMVAVLTICAALSYQRNHVYSSVTAFWEDTVSKSPNKSRVHFQLGLAYFQEGRCDAAEREYRRTAVLGPVEHRLLVDWALALDCLNRPDEAIQKLREAIAIEKTGHAYSLIGMIHAKHNRFAEALAELDTAAKIEPNYDMTYVYRGNIYLLQQKYSEAAAEFRRALAIDPQNQMARESLANALRGAPAGQ